MAGRRSVFGDVSSDGFKRRTRNGEAELDITPMIDVTFLLLIFFMVSSTMQGTPDLDVPVAKYGIGVDTEEATVITIKAGDPPIIMLGDGSGPEGTVEDVRAEVSEAVAAQKRDVVIKADREVPHGVVQEVTRAITEIEGAQFYIGVRDKPQQ